MADFSLPPFYLNNLFGPDQASNQFSLYNNRALPWPSSYVGWPTDSMGNPITAPGLQPGMTLNQTPAAPAAPAAPPAAASRDPLAPFGGYAALAQRYNPQQIQQIYNAAAGYPQQAVTGPSPSGFGSGGIIGSTAANVPIGAYAAQAAQPAAQAPAVNPSGLTAQQYLSLLAHPNYVQTPGATTPQAQPGYQPTNSVLQQFLKTWNPSQSGPGSGFAQAFARNLGMT